MKNFIEVSAKPIFLKYQTFYIFIHIKLIALRSYISKNSVFLYKN